MALNVKTLAKRFGEVVGWPFPLFLLSEVRVSATGQRSLARAAVRDGISCVWSAPPPPSPTFSVSPGGTAILARAPLVAKDQPIPELQQWVAAARLCSDRVSFPSSSLVSSFLAVVIYGFPDSHAERGRNDELLRDVFVSLGAWTCPILVAGDLNTTITQSEALSQADHWGFFRVSPNLVTTLSRDGLPSKGQPIDQMLANTQMLDMLTECKVDWGVAISDHYPLTAALVLNCGSFRIARWPQPSKFCEGHEMMIVPYPKVPQECSYSQWLSAIRGWLQKVLGTKVPPKDKMRFTTYKPPKLPVDQLYRRLLGVERAISCILEQGTTPQRQTALERKLVALRERHHLAFVHEDWLERLKEVRTWILDHTNHSHRQMMDKWRAEAVTWKISTKAAFAYLRNPKPSKTTILQEHDDFTCEPNRVEAALNAYWQTKETWPQGMTSHMAIENLVEYYSIFLPNHPYDHSFEPCHLVKAAKEAKVSSPGLDAWTIRELQMLPQEAWSVLHDILTKRFSQVGASLTGLVKRVPLEKVEGATRPDQHRPIDLFSALLRVFLSAVSQVVRPWAMNNLHKDQYASKVAHFLGLLGSLSLLGKI